MADEGDRASGVGPSKVARLNHAFGPVVAGLILDLADLATFGPVGLVAGLPVGGLAGYWMGQALGLRPRARWWCALLGGIYCTIPFTEFLPLGTLVGAYARYRDMHRGVSADENSP